MIFLYACLVSSASAPLLLWRKRYSRAVIIPCIPTHALPSTPSAHHTASLRTATLVQSTNNHQPTTNIPRQAPPSPLPLPSPTRRENVPTIDAPPRFCYPLILTLSLLRFVYINTHAQSAPHSSTSGAPAHPKAPLRTQKHRKSPQSATQAENPLPPWLSVALLGAFAAQHHHNHTRFSRSFSNLKTLKTAAFRCRIFHQTIQLLSHAPSPPARRTNAATPAA
jgi:hypothetical protein